MLIALSNSGRSERHSGPVPRLRRSILLFFCFFYCVCLSSAPDPGGNTRSYPYELWDVFTESPLTGNQLAVFTATEELTPTLMQAIAREMAYSETVFVSVSDEVGLAARMRIFSPSRELYFAGHPTIGAAFALAARGAVPSGTPEIVIGEGIGPVIVELEWEEDLRFAWMHQRVPEFGPVLGDLDGIAAALGVPPRELKSLSLPVQEVSCGSPYIIVPLATRAAVDQARLDGVSLGRIFDSANVKRRSLLIFSLESVGERSHVYSRMLRFDGSEDPATGGASGPLGSYLVMHGLVPMTSVSHIVSQQGVQMGRPSQIHIRIGTRDKEIFEVKVGGAAIYMGEGSLFIPSED